MDVALHQSSERLIHRAMALRRPESLECARDNHDPKVTASALCAGVSDMQMAFVFDLDLGCLQR